MATTYYDYSLSYDGSTIGTYQDTGLTSVAISYNGEVLANTSSSKTLSCSGKRMASDVVVGNTTVPCNDKVMKSDLGVNITPRYRWHKYNAYMVYYNYVAQQINWRGETMYVAGSSFHYTYSAALNWDGTNGYWHTSVNNIYGSGIWPPAYDGSNHYTAMMMNPWSDAGNTWRYSTHVLRAYYPRTAVYMREYTDGRIGLYNAGQTEGAWVQDCYMGSYWAQGGTDYGIVSSTDPNAYPDNTTWDGVYWYVKI